MSTFSFTPQLDDDPPEGVEREYRSCDDAIREARSFLGETVLDRSRTIASASVGVGDGGLYSSEVTWLGAWAWRPRAGWTWTPRS